MGRLAERRSMHGDIVEHRRLGGSPVRRSMRGDIDCGIKQCSGQGMEGGRERRITTSLIGRLTKK
jgi:hypothetical protein